MAEVFDRYMRFRFRVCIGQHLSNMTSKFASKLHGTSILVLGGTSGIGYAIAEACIEFHCKRLTIFGSRQSSVDDVIARIRASYPAEAFPTELVGQLCDLSNVERIEDNLTSLLDFATSFN